MKTILLKNKNYKKNTLDETMCDSCNQYVLNLINGDCLRAMNKLIKDGIKVDMILADLPYGTTKCQWDTLIPFDKLWDRFKRIRKPTTPIVLFGSEPFSSPLKMSNFKEYKYDWIWKKNRSTGYLNAKKQPMRIYENIHIFYEKQCFYNPQKTFGHRPVNNYTKHQQDSFVGRTHETYSGGGSTERYPTNILEFSVPTKKNTDDNLIHQTQKPVDLLEYLIKTYSVENDIILDCTMGSGSTGVACLQQNRYFIGIERDKDFFKKASKRINNTSKIEIPKNKQLTFNF